jgi:hypothetical protein
MDQDILINAIDAPGIKTTYESNADTNAFTDALLSKINNIEANAKDDQDADEVPYVDTNQTYALGTDVQTAIYAIDDELIAQDGRLDTAESDITNVENRLDTVEGDDQTAGSIAKALQDAKDYADTQDALQDAADEISYSDASQTYALGSTVQAAIYAIDDELIAQDGRLDTIEGDDQTAGSIAKALKDAKDYADTVAAGQDEADEISYDNTTSGLTATNIQAAIDEIDGDLDSHIADTTIHFTQAQISITESQISDLQNYLTDYTVTEADVTAHEAALTITESQISDFGSYEPANANIQSHISATDNPHSVTKTQVGLSSVENYGIASQVEAEAGTANDKYMTPLRTKEAILELSPPTDLTSVNNHIADSTIHFTQANISITESQISDFGNYEPAFTKNTAFNKDFGTIADTVTEGNDVRLSDARTPLSHTHGNITNEGAIGATADEVVVTGTSGVLTTSSRLGIDSRTSFPPSAHTHTKADITDFAHTHPFSEITATPTTLAGYGITDANTAAQIDTKIANAVSSLVDSSPAALDTLNELAAALGDDPNFATTVSNQIGLKLDANHDMTLTLSGDVNGSATFVDMGNATLSVTVADDSHNHIIANVDGLQSALDGKQPAGTYDNYSSWTLQAQNAAGTSLGSSAITSGDTAVIKAGSNVTLSWANDTVTIANAAPDQTVTITGSGATTVSGTYPNFTISSTDTNTVYTHPTYAGDDINIDTGGLTGATVISDLDFNITTDTLGHVTDANATIATRNLTAANIGALPVNGQAADSDKIDGYHIVVGSTGSDTNTLYFVT